MTTVGVVDANILREAAAVVGSGDNDLWNF
jgi:hypothetical protein